MMLIIMLTMMLTMMVIRMVVWIFCANDSKKGAAWIMILTIYYHTLCLSALLYSSHWNRLRHELGNLFRHFDGSAQELEPEIDLVGALKFKLHWLQIIYKFIKLINTIKNPFTLCWIFFLFRWVLPTYMCWHMIELNEYHWKPSYDFYRDFLVASTDQKFIKTLATVLMYLPLLNLLKGVEESVTWLKNGAGAPPVNNNPIQLEYIEYKAAVPAFTFETQCC